MSVAAVIPARGGSKGLPGKNIKPFCGKPLIAHTIEAALAARTIGHIVLSTDDEEIASICREYDIEIPFMRPVELARDDSSAVDSEIVAITVNKCVPKPVPNPISATRPLTTFDTTS